MGSGRFLLLRSRASGPGRRLSGNLPWLFPLFLKYARYPVCCCEQTSPPLFLGPPRSAASHLRSCSPAVVDLLDGDPDLDLHSDTVRIPIRRPRERRGAGEHDLLSGDPDLLQAVAVRGCWVVLSLYVRRRLPFAAGPLALVFRRAGGGLGHPDLEGPRRDNEECVPDRIQLADRYVGSG